VREKYFGGISAYYPRIYLQGLKNIRKNNSEYQVNWLKFETNIIRIKITYSRDRV
jgi:hypothetical protein